MFTYLQAEAVRSVDYAKREESRPGSEDRGTPCEDPRTISVPWLRSRSECLKDLASSSPKCLEWFASVELGNRQRAGGPAATMKQGFGGQDSGHQFCYSAAATMWVNVDAYPQKVVRATAKELLMEKRVWFALILLATICGCTFSRQSGRYKVEWPSFGEVVGDALRGGGTEIDRARQSWDQTSDNPMR
jgi:hypothetical protein